VCGAKKPIGPLGSITGSFFFVFGWWFVFHDSFAAWGFAIRTSKRFPRAMLDEGVGSRDAPRCGDLEFTSKAATLQGDSADFAARLNVKFWNLRGGDWF
jgi:hypothetical protein